jgi:hypothetical protein
MHSPNEYLTTTTEAAQYLRLSRLEVARHRGDGSVARADGKATLAGVGA